MIIYYLSFAITIAIAVAFFVQARTAIRRGQQKKIWRKRFALCVILSALISGGPFFYGTLWLAVTAGYNPHVGHGEVLIVAPIFNLALGILLAIVGRFFVSVAFG
jgi:hypothetical protein